MAEVKKPYEPKRLNEKQRELLWLRYQGSDDVLGMLIGHIDVLEAERESTLERLKSWGIPTNPTNDDPALVMAITAADDPKSNVLLCETLHDFYHQLEIIFFDGDDTRNFEDFWKEGSGIEIRFKRMSRKELDELMEDDSRDWEGF